MDDDDAVMNIDTEKKMDNEDFDRQQTRKLTEFKVMVMV